MSEAVEASPSVVYTFKFLVTSRQTSRQTSLRLRFRIEERKPERVGTMCAETSREFAGKSMRPAPWHFRCVPQAWFGNTGFGPLAPRTKSVCPEKVIDRAPIMY